MKLETIIYINPPISIDQIKNGTFKDNTSLLYDETADLEQYDPTTTVIVYSDAIPEIFNEFEAFNYVGDNTSIDFLMKVNDYLINLRGDIHVY